MEFPDYLAILFFHVINTKINRFIPLLLSSIYKDMDPVSAFDRLKICIHRITEYIRLEEVSRVHLVQTPCLSRAS